MNHHQPSSRPPLVHLDVPIAEVTLAALDAALHDFEEAYHVSGENWPSAYCDCGRIVESPEFYRTAALYALRRTARPDAHPRPLAAA